jgi:hypothetical protein
MPQGMFFPTLQASRLAVDHAQREWVNSAVGGCRCGWWAALIDRGAAHRRGFDQAVGSDHRLYDRNVINRPAP